MHCTQIGMYVVHKFPSLAIKYTFQHIVLGTVGLLLPTKMPAHNYRACLLKIQCTIVHIPEKLTKARFIWNAEISVSVAIHSYERLF